MTKNEVIDLIILYKKIVAEALSVTPEKMILFGSYAREDNREDSDIDIFIVFDVAQEMIHTCTDKVYEIAYDLEEEYGVEINPCVQQSEIFNKWKEVSPFFINVQREGIAV